MLSEVNSIKHLQSEIDHYGNNIYIRYQSYLLNVVSFFVVLCIAVCLVARLFGNISSRGPGTVSASVRMQDSDNEQNDTILLFLSYL